MKNSDLVKYVESHYDVASIKYKSLNLWLELRNRVYAKITLGEESSLKITTKTYTSVFFSIFYGYFNWFKKYDAWFFSSQVNRVLMDGKYFDRIFDYPASRYKKSLFIELTTNGHYKRSLVTSKYIVSRSFFIFLEKILAKFISIKKVNLSVYNEILKDYNIELDPKYVIKKMVSQYKLMNFLLKFRKPKIVYLSPSYTCYGYVKALKENNVKVVEIQHGVIVKEHYGYFIHKQFDDSYFVDNLLTFGENEVEVFGSNNNGIKKNNVKPIGSFYLDYIKEHYIPNEEVKKLIKNYKRSLVVSLQELEVPLRIIPELIEVAKDNLDCIFILKPRKREKRFYIENYKLPNNIIVIDDINIYQLIMDTDFHITVYSTCALEAPALGKINILFNIENKSKELLGDSLKNDHITKYVNNVNEFNVLLSKLVKPYETDVILTYNKVIYNNYKSRVNDYIAEP